MERPGLDSGEVWAGEARVRFWRGQVRFWRGQVQFWRGLGVCSTRLVWLDCEVGVAWVIIVGVCRTVSRLGSKVSMSPTSRGTSAS